MFPRTVDLNSIGHASNAHQGAALLGLLSFAAAAAPCALLVFVASRLLSAGLQLAPISAFAWCGCRDAVIARCCSSPSDGWSPAAARRWRRR